jgi:hypothetical protein
MTPMSGQFILTVDNGTKYLPAEQSKQNELDDAAAGHVCGVLTAHAAEINAGPNQNADDPYNPKK